MRNGSAIIEVRSRCVLRRAFTICVVLVQAYGDAAAPVMEGLLVVPVHIQTLIVSVSPTPSIIVLQPVEDVVQAGKYRIVPIWVGTNEATQMGIALENARFSRPMTHDLFLDALTNLDACVDHVVISDVKGSTFFARLTLRQHGRLIELDARPSDALALAVRQKAPIYIEEHVLEKASYPYVIKASHPNLNDERELADFRRFLEKLAPDDFEG